MHANITIDIGEFEYELESGHFQRATATTFDDPGDPGEVELSEEVGVFKDGQKIGEISLDAFLIEYSEDCNVPVPALRQQLEERMYDAVCEAQDSFEEDFDDRDRGEDY